MATTIAASRPGLWGTRRWPWVVLLLGMVMMVLDRKSVRGRSALWVLLGLFVTLHALIMTVPATQAWQRFAVWYASL